MATGSGLDAQLGYKLETTYGTAVTVDKFAEFDSESINWVPTFQEPSGLRVGTKFKRAGRLQKIQETIEGDFQVQFATRGMGTLVKMCLGSAVTTPTVIAGSAYKQVHTPGDFVGKSLTVQLGKPEPGGTVRALTYAGCKVVAWTFTQAEGENATLTLTLDGRSEDTAAALATATFPTGAELFTFAQVNTFKLGGTPTTAAGETTIASGVQVPGIVKSFTLTGTTAMDVERFGLGNAGLKGAPIENGIPTITGSLEAEWDKVTFYDLFKATTATALEFKQEGSVISGSDKNTNSLIIPAVKFKAAPFDVSGPEVISGTVEFEAYSNEVDPVLQWKLISADSTAL